MAYMSCLAPCAACHKPFTFNPSLVPSIRIEGVREPVCRDCMDAINAKRVQAGLDPFHILPGAYEAEECA